MLIHSVAPLSFWVEALQMATFLLNRRPCRASSTTTPHELLLGTRPNYDELRVFGCPCYPNITATTPHKLSPRSAWCVFIGYPLDHRGYRCYDIASCRVYTYTSRHVVFVEDQFPFRVHATAHPQPAPPKFSTDDDDCADVPHVAARAPRAHPSPAAPMRTPLPNAATHTPTRSTTPPVPRRPHPYMHPALRQHPRRPRRRLPLRSSRIHAHPARRPCPR